MASISGLDQLDAVIAALDPDDLVAELKAAGAQAIADKAVEQYSDGRGPSDAVWPLRKKDGALALRRPVGTIVFVETPDGIRGVAEDVMGYHMERRPWCPEDGELSAPWARAADEAMDEALEERLGKVK